MNTKTIARHDEIPNPPKTLWVAIHRAGTGSAYTVLSPRHQGYLTHWTGEKTLPCYLDRELCYDACSLLTRRWYAFIHCIRHPDGKHVVLQIPAGAMRQLRDGVDSMANYRGLKIWVERGQGHKSRLRVEIKERPLTVPSTLPRAVDVHESVLALWRIGQIAGPWASVIDGDPDDTERRGGTVSA